MDVGKPIREIEVLPKHIPVPAPPEREPTPAPKEKEPAQNSNVFVSTS